MRVNVKRTGGLAGLRETLADVDTTALERRLAEEVERCVEEASFFDLPSKLPGAEGADLFRYQVTVVDGRRRHTVSFEAGEVDEESGSGPPAAVVRLLETISRSA